jgi:hypothetical protein
MFSTRLNRAPFALAFLVCHAVVLAMLLLTDDAEALAVAALLTVFVLLPLSIRRLHDVDMTGWAACVLFIPVAGSLCALILCFVRGTDGENRFGHDPILLELPLQPRWNVRRDAVRKQPPGTIGMGLDVGDRSKSEARRAPILEQVEDGLTTTWSGVRCSFCRKAQDDVFGMFAGPDVCICAECVEMFASELAQQRSEV